MARGAPDYIDAYDPGLFPFVDTGLTEVITASDTANNSIKSIKEVPGNVVAYFYTITLSARWEAGGYARIFVGEEDTTNLYNIINKYGEGVIMSFHDIPFPKPLRIVGPKRLWIQTTSLNVWGWGFAYGFSITEP